MTFGAEILMPIISKIQLINDTCKEESGIFFYMDLQMLGCEVGSPHDRVVCGGALKALKIFYVPPKCTCALIRLLLPTLNLKVVHILLGHTHLILFYF